MIPILYDETETEFLSNGIGQLDETLVCEVTESGHEQFELYLEYPSKGRYMEEITEFRYIQARPNDLDEDHAFRIYDIDKETGDGVIRVYAETKSNDLGGNLIKELELLDGTPQMIFNMMKAQLMLPSNYNFQSDITKTGSVHWERRNPLNCIVGERGSLIDVFGGEIKRTNDYIYLYERRGRDRVTTIRPETNLEGLRMTVSTKGLVTKILPYFTYYPGDGEEPEIVYGDIVNSPKIDNYPVTTIRAIDFSTYDEVEDLNSLNTKAATYFTSMNTEIDKPKVSLDVDLIQIAESPTYKHYKGLETIGLTDTVEVWVEEFDINVEAKVNTLVYDVLGEKVTRLSAGTKSMSLYQSNRNEYQQGLDSIQKYVNNGLDHAVQVAANDSNRVFRGITQPTEGMRKNDVWYKPVGNGGIELYLFDGVDWNLDKVSADLLTGQLDVQNGDVNLININANNITLNRGRFIELSANELNSSFYLTGSQLRYVHNNTGSETRIDANGLFHREGGTNYSTHYLMEVGTRVVDSQGGPTSKGELVTLPSVFRGKQFKVVLGIADVLSYQEADYESLAIQRLVAIIVPNSINHSNGTFRVYGYARMINVNTGNTKFVPLQLHYTAIV